MTPNPTPPARLIGLTGGIGSGKSTVAAILKNHFALAVIDADGISRGLTAAHGAAIDAIAHAFGADFISPDGALDRERMRSHIFGQAEHKTKLEGILHPLIFEAIHAAANQALEQGEHTVVLDIPLLVESARWRPILHDVLVVDCPVALQIERVQQRSQLARQEVERIIQSQATRPVRLACADVVIYNASAQLTQLEIATKTAARFLGLAERV